METVTINQILYILITAVLIPVLTLVGQYVKIKTSGIKNDVIRGAINNVWDAVVYVSQVFVDDCKKSGNFDADAQAKAFNMAKTAALDTMSETAKKYIEKYCGDLDEWLKIQIEAAVKGTKN